MKKILYVTTVSRTINAFLVPHIRNIVKEGNNVEIACNIDLDISEELSDIKLNKIDFSRNPFSIDNLKAIKQIRKLYKVKKYDIVHVHTPVASFITRYALKDKSVKIIYTAHGFHFYNGASKLNWFIYYSLEKLASKWTDVLITINNEDFKRAKSKFENKRCEVHKINGIGIDLKNYKKEEFDLRFKKELGLEENDFVITVIAELIKRKNHNQIIEAVSRIEEKSNVKIIFVGNGILFEEIKRKIKAKNLNENIKLLGYRTDVSKIISISDVIALFSLHEGLPRNLMEGMAQGKAILCTNIRGNNDLIEDRENGILVSVNDYNETKNRIIEMTRNIKLTEELGKNNEKKVELYDIKNVLKQMDKIYKKIN